MSGYWVRHLEEKDFIPTSDNDERRIPEPGPSDEEIASWSDEEFARQIAPVRLVGGTDEYRLAEPDIELARRIRAGDVPQSSPPSQEAPPLEDELSITGGPAVDPTRGKILGIDDRSVVGSPTVYPFSTSLVMNDGPLVPTPPGESSKCSGTLIGPSTALSAAHCYYAANEGWRAPMTWALGRKTTRVRRTNFSYSTAYGPTWQCYWVTIPTGAMTNTFTLNDYAVMEFANDYPNCNLQPGNQVGWLGWMVATPSQMLAAPSVLRSYPSQPPASIAFLNPWPTLYTSSSPAYTVMPSHLSYEILHEHDTTGAQSGAGLAQRIHAGNGNDNLYVTAIHVGDSYYVDDSNFARKVDSTVAAFITAYGAP